MYKVKWFYILKDGTSSYGKYQIFSNEKYANLFADRLLSNMLKMDVADYQIEIHQGSF